MFTSLSLFSRMVTQNHQSPAPNSPPPHPGLHHPLCWLLRNNHPHCHSHHHSPHLTWHLNHSQIPSRHTHSLYACRDHDHLKCSSSFSSCKERWELILRSPCLCTELILIVPHSSLFARAELILGVTRWSWFVRASVLLARGLLVRAEQVLTARSLFVCVEPFLMISSSVHVVWALIVSFQGKRTRLWESVVSFMMVCQWERRFWRGSIEGGGSCGSTIFLKICRFF